MTKMQQDNPVTIFFHANCPDGFGAAWWLGRQFDNPKCRPMAYGDPIPFLELQEDDVYVVDFCFDSANLEALACYCKTVTVLDHHKTAIDYVAGALSYSFSPTVQDLIKSPSRLRVCLNMDRSGVGLVTEYVQALTGEMPPRFLLNIEDRDLWRFEMADTRPIFAAVTSHPYEVEHWERMATELHSDLEHQGEAIERYRDQLIDFAVSTAYVTTVLGYQVWVAQCPYAIGSDVAGRLAERVPTLFGAYYIDQGKTRRWGLRSLDSGLDVAELAATVGGGGHARAAGFELIGGKAAAYPVDQKDV